LTPATTSARHVLEHVLDGGRGAWCFPLASMNWQRAAVLHEMPMAPRLRKLCHAMAYRAAARDVATIPCVAIPARALAPGALVRIDLTTPIDPPPLPAGEKIGRAPGLVIGARTSLADIARV
jgi:hypothetical protein